MKKALMIVLALLIGVAFVSTAFAQQIKGAKEEAAPARTTPGKAAPAGTPGIKGAKEEAAPAK